MRTIVRAVAAAWLFSAACSDVPERSVVDAIGARRLAPQVSFHATPRPTTPDAGPEPLPEPPAEPEPEPVVPPPVVAPPVAAPRVYTFDGPAVLRRGENQVVYAIHSSVWSTSVDEIEASSSCRATPGGYLSFLFSVDALSVGTCELRLRGTDAEGPFETTFSIDVVEAPPLRSSFSGAAFRCSPGNVLEKPIIIELGGALLCRSLGGTLFDGVELPDVDLVGQLGPDRVLTCDGRWVSPAGCAARNASGDVVATLPPAGVGDWQIEASATPHLVHAIWTGEWTKPAWQLEEFDWNGQTFTPGRSLAYTPAGSVRDILPWNDTVVVLLARSVEIRDPRTDDVLLTLPAPTWMPQVISLRFLHIDGRLYSSFAELKAQQGQPAPPWLEGVPGVPFVAGTTGWWQSGTVALSLYALSPAGLTELAAGHRFFDEPFVAAIATPRGIFLTTTYGWNGALLP